MCVVGFRSGMHMPAARCLSPRNCSHSHSLFWTGGERSWSKLYSPHAARLHAFILVYLRHTIPWLYIECLFFVVVCGKSSCSSQEQKWRWKRTSGGSISMVYARTTTTMKRVRTNYGLDSSIGVQCLEHWESSVLVPSSGCDEFITSLQKFMETSSLGEFSTRLSIVTAFWAEMKRKSNGLLY